MKHKPSYLPQINMPVDMAVKKLDEEDIDYEYIQIQPSESDGINPSQGFTFGDDVGKVKLDDKNPIWIAKEGDKDKICDGHHRYIRALLDGVPLTAIKIDMDFKDACRLLNKIQDIYEYEEKQQMEEVVAQDIINNENQSDSGVSNSEFLASLEENNVGIQTETPSKNQQTVIGYRREPIKENSVIGNFFTLNPMEGFNKYEIDFENLLDTHALGVTYKDGQEPVEILTKIWFPHINFEKLSEQYNVPAINLKNKAIAEKAQTMGYDGIKHGDKLVQGLK